MKNSSVTDAVKNLRKALNETQQGFAAKLGMSVATVVRHEHSRPPGGRALAKLAQLAREHGHENYAAIFRAALAEQLGSFLPVVTYTSLDCATTEERDYVAALLSILRASPNSKEAVKVKKVLTPQVLALRQSRASEEAFQESQHAVVKMLKAGRRIEDVAKSFRAEFIADAVLEIGGGPMTEAHMGGLVELLVKEGHSAHEIAERWYLSELDQVIHVLTDRGLFHAIPDEDEASDVPEGVR